MRYNGDNEKINKEHHMLNRQWLLKCRPEDKMKPSDFEYREIELDGNNLQPGEALVCNRMFAMAPTMRNALNNAKDSYGFSVDIGDTVKGLNVCEVVKSRNADWPEGSRFTALSGWEDYAIVDLTTPSPFLSRLNQDTEPADALGLCGGNAMSAYVGLLKVGDPKPGETLVVSAAAGSVGSVAAQIGKIKGCKVIGIAGGPQKCQWLVDELQLDAAIDYKTDNVRESLAAQCPNGVNLFFDNVGGDILQAVVDNIAYHGRIVVCGQVSAYDSDATAPGPRDMMKIVYWSVRMQGFLLSDFPEEFEHAQQDLLQWGKEGKIKHYEDIRDGFANLPSTFMDLFSGANTGTLMLNNDLPGMR